MSIRTIRNQAGDTIVEVLLSMTVLALLLGGASVLTNRSTRSLQQTQENAVAQRIAQGQLEYFKTYIRSLENKDIGAIVPSDGFCMSSRDDDTEKTPETDADTCASGQVDGGAQYKTSIVVTPISGVTGAYNARVTVSWDGLTVTKGNIDIDYRLYNVTGAKVALQTGQICATGQKKGPAGNCVDLDPAIKAVVRVIRPDRDGSGGLVEPLCTKPAFDPINNVSIGLTKSGGAATFPNKLTSTAAGESSVIYTPLQLFGNYVVRINTVPSGYIACGNRTSENVSINAGNADPVRVATFDLLSRIPKQATVNEASYHYPGWHLAAPSWYARQTRTFTFTNPSNSTTALTSVSASLSNPASYTMSSNSCSGNLNPGASCSVTVAFSPASGTSSYNYFGNTGDRQSSLTLSNTNGVTATAVSLVGRTYSNSMRSGDSMTQAEDDRLVSYNAACYNNVTACSNYRTYIYGNGNLAFSNTYCQWGGGNGNYINGSTTLAMQGDGNFVYYGEGGGVYYNAATSGGSGNWLNILDDGGVVVDSGYFTGNWLKIVFNGGTAQTCGS